MRLLVSPSERLRSVRNVSLPKLRHLRDGSNCGRLGRPRFRGSGRGRSPATDPPVAPATQHGRKSPLVRYATVTTSRSLLSGPIVFTSAIPPIPGISTVLLPKR